MLGLVKLISTRDVVWWVSLLTLSAIAVVYFRAIARWHCIVDRNPDLTVHGEVSTVMPVIF